MTTDICISNESLERIQVTPEFLLLDNKNPRFFGEDINLEFLESMDIDNPRLQEYLRMSIYNKYNVQELINSIMEAGFLKLDPIVVVKDKEKYRVVEGNRRLTAIKTILGNSLRKVCEVPEHVLESINEIEVVQIVGNYDDSTIWLLQGIRHVSGIRDWGPFQQAELIKTLYEKKDYTFKKIGAIIGLSPQRASTILKGYYGVEQMMNDDKWSQYATPDLFSHFEQAYVRAPIREWLEWDKDSQQYMNKENLNKFYRWIATDDPELPRPKVLSRDVRDKLPSILEHPEAKEAFTSEEMTIDEAFSLTLTNTIGKSELGKASKNYLKTLDRLSHASSISTADKKTLTAIQDKIHKVLAI